MLDVQNPEIFRSALEGVQTGVCMVDLDRRISFWNKGAESITGYLRQDVMGRFCGEILLIKFHENKAAICEHSCPLLAAMRDGTPRESRVYLHHKSGYAVPVSLRAVPIRDAHGHVIGATESFIERPCVSAPHRPELNLAVGHGLDAVTQLPDYSFTKSYLASRSKFAAEHAIPFGFLCIQLDQLNELTATRGLEAAEAILNVVAHTLRNALDPLDFVGRWSEDQFLAIVANCTDADLFTTAERLKRLAQSSEVAWWGDQVSIAVSVGGTVVVPGEPLATLWQRTKAALNSAVAKGGSSVCVLPTPATP
jgi:diguanylate cyclase (GGDEF)-like protein/PAS domain S-box-containing protein